ncbi:MAG: M56 family metallopeptidase [Defluviitaleaceae bacterium]|nr:M56 family metallopeptidase [Defluviitaleaceae bacterium]
MGVVFHHVFSLYSFVMGAVWFTVFIMLGLLMRRSKHFVKFSVIPLLLLLILSVLRMFAAVTVPGTVVIRSEVLYPLILSVLRYEIVLLFEFSVTPLSLLIGCWFAVAAYLFVRYFYGYICKLLPILNLFGSHERDEYAESLLADIIGSDKHFRVFRHGGFKTAAATAFKPYIILPTDADFSPDELRAVLLHEWKHIQDKDYLTDIVVEVICCVFWWNPLVYVLRDNFRFATELKSDEFAVSNKTDFVHYLRGLNFLDATKKADESVIKAFTGIGSDREGLADRLQILGLRFKSKASRRKRMWINLFYSATIVVLFLGSYMFLVVPAVWESPDVPVSAEYLAEYQEGGGVLRVDEHFLIDNEDGTFSLYIDGVFIMYVDYDSELVNWTPIRPREDRSSD